MTFNEDYLYDGPWRVLWKTNTSWQRYFDPFNGVADNRAYQWYEKVRYMDDPAVIAYATLHQPGGVLNWTL